MKETTIMTIYHCNVCDYEVEKDEHEDALEAFTEHWNEEHEKTE